jgi:hypothetical protein
VRKIEGRLIEALLFLTVILFFACAGGQFFVLGDGLSLPPLEGLTGYGCTSTRLLNGTMRASAWADYDEAHIEAVRKNRFPLEFQKANPPPRLGAHDLRTQR